MAKQHTKQARHRAPPAPPHPQEGDDSPPGRDAPGFPGPPFFIALGASAAWIVVTALYIDGRRGWGDFSAAPTHELAIALCGIFAPVAVFWLIALFWRRDHQLRAEAAGIRQSLSDFLFPIEDPENKAAALRQALRGQVKELNGATSQARVEVARIEAIFKAQVGALREATGQAAEQAREIKKSFKQDNADFVRFSRELAAQTQRTSAEIADGASALDETTGQAAAQADRSLEALGQTAKKFQEIMDRAGESATELGKRLEFHMSVLNAASENTTEKTGLLGRSLKAQLQTLETAGEAAASQSERINSALSESAGGLSRTAQTVAGQAAEIEQTVAAHVATMAAHAETVTQRTAEAGRSLRKQTEEALSNIVEVIAQVTAASEKFGTETAGLTQTTKAAAETLAEAAGGLGERGAAIGAGWREAVDGAMEKLTAAGEEFRLQAGEIAEAADLSADRMIGRVEQARDFLEGSALDLEGKTQAATAAVDEAAGRLGRCAEGLDQTVAGASQQVAGLGEHLSAASEALSAAMSGLSHQSGELHDGLKSQTGDLSVLAEDITGKMATAEQALGGHVANLSAALKDVDQAEKSLTGTGERLGEVIAGCRQLIEGTAGELSGLMTGLDETARAAAGGIVKTGDELSRQSAAFAAFEDGGRQGINSLMEALGGVEGKFSEVLALAEQFQAEAGGIAATSRDAEQRFTGAAEAISGETARLAEQLRGAGDGLDGQQEKLRHQFETAAERLERAGAAAREHAQNLIDVTNLVSSTLTGATRSVADRTEQLALASQAAAQAAELTGKSVVTQSRAIAEATGDLISRKQMIEREENKVTHDAFLRTSTTVIEALNSLAMDLAKVLDADLSDKLWQRYVAGDRSLFSRRILKLGSRGLRLKIARKYRVDPEFRAHAQRFLEQFEALLARAKASDRDGTLSVTFLSSNIGKVYVLLAQSLGRLK